MTTYSRLALAASGATILACLAVVLALGELVGRHRGGYAGWSAGTGLSAPSNLPVADHVAAKLTWVKALPARELVLLGNSRVVFLSAAHVGTEPAGFANMAVGGTTFRQSVATLEAMAGVGRAPATAIIGLDPWPMEPWGESNYPPAYATPGRALEDAARIGARTGQWRIVVRSLLYDLDRARMAFADAVKMDTVRRRLAFLAGADDGSGATTVSFAADGHMPQRPSTRKGPPPEARLRPAPPARAALLMEERFRNDLDRLAELGASTGMRIVVVELPMDPASTRHADDRTGGWFREARRRFAEDCAARGLECRLDPPVAHDDNGSGWPDCCHAPAARLAAWMRAAVN